MTPARTILFVDDDPDFLLAKKTFFEARGHTVHTVEQPDEALELLDDLRPDIVFVDLMMERIDSGFRLAYQLRQRPGLSATPVVMLSGVAAATGRRFDGEADGLRAWSRIDRFIDKPVSGEQLVAVMDELLDQAGAGDAGDGDAGDAETTADRHVA